MNKVTRILALALAILMLVVCAASLTSCNDSAEPVDTIVEQPSDKCENCGADLPTKDKSDAPKKDYTVEIIIISAILVVIGSGSVVVRYFLDKRERHTDTHTENNGHKNN